MRFCARLSLAAMLAGVAGIPVEIVHAQQVPNAGVEQADAEQAYDPLRLLRGSADDDQQDAIFGDLQEEEAQLAEEAASEAARAGAGAREFPVPGTQGRALPAAGSGRVTVDGNTTLANRRTAPVEEGSERRAEEDPFSASGLRFGSWRANPYVEQTVGFTTNASRSATGGSGSFSQTEIGGTLLSDWARHQAAIEGRLAIRRNFGETEETVPEATVNGALRLDLLDGYTATIGAGYGYTTEALTSTNLPTGASERPGVHSLDGSAQIERTGGRVELLLRGSVGRTIYEDATLAGGGTQSQADRDSTLYTLTGRVGYRVSSAFIPFIEAEAGTRRFDEKLDRNGEQRDSIILGARAGMRVDLGEKLNGEVALGYRAEDFAGKGLDTLSGVTIDGTLNWSPERDSLVSLTSSTEFRGATGAGISGSTVQSFDVSATRRITDRLELNAVAGVEISREDGADETGVLWNLGTGLRYWLSRSLALTGTVEHERFDGTQTVKPWEATSVRAGVRVQR